MPYSLKLSPAIPFKGVETAIDSGVDVLAHTVPQSPPWTPEFCARLKRAHLLDPILTLFDFEARDSSASECWGAQMVAELRAYSAAGGEIIFGSDIGCRIGTTPRSNFASAAAAESNPACRRI